MTKSRNVSKKTFRDQRCERSMESIFLPELSCMHCVSAPSDQPKRAYGKTLVIDPDFGSGEYWYCLVNDTIALVSFEITESADTVISSHVPDSYCFGCYGKAMVPHFCPYMRVAGAGEGTLLGYAWRSGENRETIRVGTTMRASSIYMLPDGLRLTAEEIDCSSEVLAQAISSLDGSVRIPALVRLFDEMSAARPSPAASAKYYECKALEACILLMSWYESRSSKHAFPLPPADRTAFHLACAYAREHLAEPLSVEDLCHVACVSESKLTRMFHATEGTTPIQWLRDQRLEEAARLLVRTDLSIGAIAHRVGFIRQGSLTSAFSRRYQMTPLAWRKRKSSR